MSRPTESWATLGPILSRLAADAPVWVSPQTRRAAATLLEHLRDDVLVVLTDGPAEAARGLGVARMTLHRWREATGWLSK